MGLCGQHLPDIPRESGPPKFHKYAECGVCKKVTLFAPRPDWWLCVKCGSMANKS